MIKFILGKKYSFNLFSTIVLMSCSVFAANNDYKTNNYNDIDVGLYSKYHSQVIVENYVTYIKTEMGNDVYERIQYLIKNKKKDKGNIIKKGFKKITVDDVGHLLFGYDGKEEFFNELNEKAISEIDKIVSSKIIELTSDKVSGNVLESFSTKFDVILKSKINYHFVEDLKKNILEHLDNKGIDKELKDNFILKMEEIFSKIEFKELSDKIYNDSISKVTKNFEKVNSNDIKVMFEDKFEEYFTDKMEHYFNNDIDDTVSKALNQEYLSGLKHDLRVSLEGEVVSSLKFLFNNELITNVEKKLNTLLKDEISPKLIKAAKEKFGEQIAKYLNEDLYNEINTQYVKTDKEIKESFKDTFEKSSNKFNFILNTLIIILIIFGVFSFFIYKKINNSKQVIIADVNEFKLLSSKLDAMPKNLAHIGMSLSKELEKISENLINNGSVKDNVIIENYSNDRFTEPDFIENAGKINDEILYKIAQTFNNNRDFEERYHRVDVKPYGTNEVNISIENHGHYYIIELIPDTSLYVLTLFASLLEDKYILKHINLNLVYDVEGEEPSNGVEMIKPALVRMRIEGYYELVQKGQIQFLS